VSSNSSIPKVGPVVRIELPYALVVLEVVDRLLNGLPPPPVTKDRLEALYALRHRIFDCQAREGNPPLAAGVRCRCGETDDAHGEICPMHGVER
jgi:hypothetical protein